MRSALLLIALSAAVAFREEQSLDLVEEVGARSLCGGTTRMGKTDWNPFGSAGLSVEVDTSECKFPHAPTYLPVVIGDSRHWQLTGTDCVYDSDHRSFRIFVFHPSMRREKLLGHAKQFWHVSWVGSNAKTSGTTPGGPQAQWKQFGSHSLYIDVDTSSGGFPSTPHYVTALNGYHSHWRTVGAHSLYTPTKSSLRIYVLYELSAITVKQAQEYHWSINWIGSFDSYSGTSDGHWNPIMLSGDQAAYIDVDTSQSKFRVVPAYVTSFVVNGVHQWVIGSAALYKPRVNGFRTYVDRIMNVKALKKTWRVSYLGYEGPQDCKVSKWASWGSCSTTCGGGIQRGFRNITQAMYLGGQPCPALNRTRLCNTNHCPIPCKISAWNAWESCTKSCAYGRMFRSRAVSQEPKYGGKPCPKLKESKGCNLFPCAGTGRSIPCGATTIAGKTEWKIKDKAGMYVEIDTTACKFRQTQNGYMFTPYYTASVMGHDPKFTASSSIFKPMSRSFSVYVWHPEMSGKKLWFYATRFKWVVSWIGDAGSNCGKTSEGLTGWKAVPDAPHSLYVDVNTQASAFAATPTYIPSLYSALDSVAAIGVHNVFNADKKGFRLYIAFPKKVTPLVAEGSGWTLVWMGSHSIMSGVSPASSKWKDAEDQLSSKSLNKAIYIDVDSSANFFPRVPNYVVAVTGMGAPHGWDPYGGGSLYKATATGFRLYLWNSGKDAAYANKNSWQVNYLGYTKPTDCKVSKWGKYSTCTKTCAGGSMQRLRHIDVHPYGGVPCPSLNQTTICNKQSCPIDCKLTAWTEWAECSKTCGGGSTLKTRKVRVEPKYGGVSCAALKKSKACNIHPCPIDCSVSGWNAWSKCNRECGVDGKRTRHRQIARFPKFGGVPCPVLNETLPCNHLPCVGAGEGKICGGKTKAEWQEWKQFGSSGLFMDVDTSHCKFQIIPNYVCSVVGDKSHWQLTGVNSIYSASETKFRVYLWHPTLYSTNLRSVAIQYNWDLNWLADTGQKSGITTEGTTGWKQLSHNVIYVDVDTINSKYPVTPRYITSIRGDRDQWRVQGAHSIYNPESDGFRVYLLYPSVVAAEAEKKGWTISWVGSYDDSYSGQSSCVWQEYRQHKGGPVSALYIDVDTSRSKFHGVPTYVTSVTGESHHWSVTGASSIYKPTETKFRVYLDKADNAYFAKAKKWRINYVGYQGSIDCTVSEWSSWSQCPASCVPTMQYRIRKIIKNAFNGGRCYKLKEKRQCNEQGCPVDCKVSDFGAWAVCSVSCGGGVQKKFRTVLQKREFSGKPCPELSESRACSSAACGSIKAKKEAPDCRNRNVFGSWSKCTKYCGTGFRYRYREHIMCSARTHFVPYKMKFRQKMHCNIKQCKDATEAGKSRDVVIPAIIAKNAKR